MTKLLSYMVFTKVPRKTISLRSLNLLSFVIIEIAQSWEGVLGNLDLILESLSNFN
jgi:hypothetical protein